MLTYTDKLNPTFETGLPHPRNGASANVVFSETVLEATCALTIEGYIHLTVAYLGLAATTVNIVFRAAENNNCPTLLVFLLSFCVTAIVAYSNMRQLKSGAIFGQLFFSAALKLRETREKATTSRFLRGVF